MEFQSYSVFLKHLSERQLLGPTFANFQVIIKQLCDRFRLKTRLPQESSWTGDFKNGITFENQAKQMVVIMKRLKSDFLAEKRSNHTSVWHKVGGQLEWAMLVGSVLGLCTFVNKRLWGMVPVPYPIIFKGEVHSNLKIHLKGKFTQISKFS